MALRLPERILERALDGYVDASGWVRNCPIPRPIGAASQLLFQMVRDVLSAGIKVRTGVQKRHRRCRIGFIQRAQV